MCSSLPICRKRGTQKMPRRLIRVAYVGEKLGDTSALKNSVNLEEIRRMGRGD
jgi:hypothetical protein